MLVPWDDDVDILVSLVDRRRLKTALLDLEPDFSSFESAGHLKVGLQRVN